MITIQISTLLGIVITCIFVPALFTFLLTVFAKEKLIQSTAPKEAKQTIQTLKKQLKIAQNELVTTTKKLSERENHLQEIEQTFLIRKTVKRV